MMLSPSNHSMPWLIVLLATSIATAQSPSGPALVPSLVTSERYIAEQISDPWYPPTNYSEQVFSAPAFAPAPAANVATSPAAVPQPVPAVASNPMAVPAPAEETLPAPLAEAPLEGATDILSEEVIVKEGPWYTPGRWVGPMPWDTGLELGLNGSSGNNESFSMRTGGYIKRESRFSKLDLSTYYNKTTTRDSTTQNNAQFDARNDWLLDDSSPWTLFGTGSLFYDQFQAFDLQVSANTGIGYRFYHTPELKLIGRVGGGTSREIGGPDDRWVPESLFGVEYNQRLNNTQKLYAKIDYFPEWEEVGEFRMVNDVGWEVSLTEPENLSLKVSVTDRYDSSPNGVDPHLLNYSVLLLFKL